MTDEKQNKVIIKITFSLLDALSKLKTITN